MGASRRADGRWIEIAAFTFFHGIPVEIGPAKPYWGDGMGDPLQWGGLHLDPGLQRRHRQRCAASAEGGRHTRRHVTAVGGHTK
jgi:hypothetical protein